MVTADDFGLSAAVNEAVERAHTNGILSAASLMVGGPAASDALACARRLPTLAVGLHLVLVEGQPLLRPESVPDLVDGNGAFRSDLFAFGVDIFLRPRVRAQLVAEIDAQFAAYAATGLALDHVNAHKHFHLHPTVAALVLDIGSRYGMRSMRVPFEPAAVLAKVDANGTNGQNGPRASAWFSNLWARRLKAQMQRRGLNSPDQVFGIAWSGAMTEARIAGLLERLPAGVTEIYVHPAICDDFEGAARGYRYASELAALTAVPVRALCRASGARIGGFAELVASRAESAESTQ